MKFKQYENGSCDIEFSKEEIEILIKKGKIHLSDESLKHFGNNLIKIVSDWNIKFNEKIASLHTFTDTEIKTK
jgi:hypothetical protein